MRIYPVLLLRYEFEITDMGDEHVAVCVGESANHYHGMIKLSNDSALFMFEQLKQGITLPELIMACMNKFGGDVNEVGPIVMEFLDNLKNEELLVADTTRGIKDDRDEVASSDAANNSEK